MLEMDRTKEQLIAEVELLRATVANLEQDKVMRKRVEEAEREQAQELAVLKERQRLACDLHDTVDQTLFAASLIAQTLLRQWEDAPAKLIENLEHLDRLVRAAQAEMRLLLLELRPEVL